jgi:hypothetical protein
MHIPRLAILLAACLLAFPALAQTPQRTGSLTVQGALSEIAANGAQATARANLGVSLNVPNGVAGLDGSGLVPVARLPSLGTLGAATVGSVTAEATTRAAADTTLTTAAAAAQTTANLALPTASAGPLATQAGANSLAAIVAGLGYTPLNPASPTFTGTLSGAAAAFTGNATIGGTLGVTGAATAASLQSTGVGVINAGSVGSQNGISLRPFAPGTTPQIQAVGPAGTIGLNIQTQSGGIIGLVAPTLVSGYLSQALTTALASNTVNNAVSSGLFLSQTFSGTSAVALGGILNSINITDNVNWTGTNNGVAGFNMTHNYGGAATRGGRIAAGFVLNQTAATADLADLFYTALSAGSNASFNNGGTGLTSLTAKGRNFGFNPSAALRSGATNWFQNSAAEFNVEIQAGASAYIRSGITVASLNGPVQGSVTDTAFWVYGLGAKWKSIFTIGGTQAWPVDPAGTILLADAQSGGTAGIGIDFSSVTFATAFLKSIGFLVDGSGNSTIGGTLAVAGTLSGAGVTALLAPYAPLVSPAFTGTPSLPTGTVGITQAANDNTTKLATTAYVVGQAGTATPLINGTAAIGTSLLYARQDHVHPTDTTRAPLASPTFTGTINGAAEALTGNETIGGTLGVSGVATLSAGATLGNDTFAAIPLTINGATGQTRQIRWQTASVLHWAVGMSITAESGSNVGADFSINRYSDAGALLDSPLIINRATGALTLTGAGTFGGIVTASAYKVGATAGVSCTAGVVSLVTEVVTNGIVTHC